MPILSTLTSLGLFLFLAPTAIEPPPVPRPLEWDQEELDLSPRNETGTRYQVQDSLTYSQHLARAELRVGEEVVFHMRAGEAATGGLAPVELRREMEIERKYLDQALQVADRDGKSVVTSLERSIQRLRGELEIVEQGTSRGPRRKQLASVLQGRVLTISRATPEAPVSAVLKPRAARNPQEEPPADPPAEDLALSFIEGRLEQILPAKKVAPGASWELSAPAVRALLGGADGYPFPRGESLSGGIGAGARGRDPVSVFLARGALSAKATLAAVSGGVAQLEIEFTLSLDKADIYAPLPAEGEAAAAEEKNEDDAAEARADEGAQDESADEPAGDRILWSGKIACRGTASFSLELGTVTGASLSGDVEMAIEGRGPEGPGQVELDLELKGKIERTIQVRRLLQ